MCSWDRKLEKHSSGGQCSAVSHFATMWLCWTGSQYPCLNNLLSSGTLRAGYHSVCDTLWEKHTEREEAKIVTQNLRERHLVQPQNYDRNKLALFLSMKQDDATLETILESAQVGANCSSDGEITSEELGKKERDCARITVLVWDALCPSTVL